MQDYEKAEKLLGEAEKAFAKAMTAGALSEARNRAGDMLYHL